MLSIPVQTREVGKLKKHLSPVVILVALLVAAIPFLSGCSATTNQVKVTIPGPGTEGYSEAARAADEAVAAVTKSAYIEVPADLGGILRVASDGGYPPLEFEALVTAVGEDKGTLQLVGFETDLMTAVAKKLGVQIESTIIRWSEQPEAFDEGKVDIAASGAITGQAMMERFAFSEAYLPADLAILTRADVQIPDEAALQGKVIGVQKGSTAETYAASLDQAGEIRLYDHVTGAFSDLEESKIDTVLVAEPIAIWILANDEGYAEALEITGSIETGQGYAFWAAGDDEALLAAVNAALEELKEVPAGAATASTSTTLPGETTTTAGAAEQSKSVYQLLLEKWGLAGI